MKLLKTALCGALFAATSAMALDASSLKLQVYSVMLSASPLCTNPVTVFSSATPTEVDFLATPTLGAGNPPDGTYECVIIKMSDLIKFTPSATGGTCVAAQEYTADVCRTDNGGTTQAPDTPGAPSNCNGTDPALLSDRVHLYLKTNVTAGGGGQTFLQPTSTTSTNGLRLTSPLVIARTASSKFSVNATGAVSGANPTGCGMNPPTCGFYKLP